MPEAAYTVLALFAVLGVLVVITQIRYEYRKRKAFRDVDRIIQKRQAPR